MKASDKVNVEMLAEDAAFVYVLLGKTSSFLGVSAYKRLEEILGDDSKQKACRCGLSWEQLRAPAVHKNTILDVFFPQETEQQKQIRELKETIDKARKQIEDLEKTS